MPVYSPRGKALREVEAVVVEAAARAGVSLPDPLRFSKPPEGYGFASLPMHQLARELGRSPVEVAERVAAEARPRGLVERLVAVRGFLNAYVDWDRYASLVLETVARLRERYGYNPACDKLRILVEHTSANPIKPLHVGHLRNALLGDSLARLLKLRGHDVTTHFYINDVGLQVAYAAYGYRCLKSRRPQGKVDHWVGVIYSAVNALATIVNLRNRYEQVRDGDPETARRLLREIDEWMGVAARLKERYPEVFEALLKAVESSPDPTAEIVKLNRDYERGELSAVRLIRNLCQACIEGFKQTLSRLDVFFDSWDWESELTVWNGFTAEILDRLRETGYVERVDGALVFKAGKAVEDLGLRERLNIPEGYEVPDLTLVRSDGTTLYTTRDIAYTLWKFRHADRVVNVIGAQQSLAQLQIRIALHVLGHVREAANLVHYSYEIVNIEGRKMSGRRGVYVTVDELLDEAVNRAYSEVCSKSPHLPEEEKRRIAETVGVGAVRFAFLAVSPSKPVSFRWSKVLDFSQNSGPFIQYAYTRARSIIFKSGVESPLDAKVDISLLKHPMEKSLVEMVGEFPETVAYAADEMRVDVIAGFANELALKFNSYYDSVPVLSAETAELRRARLALVHAVATTLANALTILGIRAPEKM